jgi:L,D-transpeptidase-like protein
MRALRLAVPTIVMLAATGVVESRVGAQTTPLEVRQAATNDSSLRVVVSVARRTLWVLTGPHDTLLSAPVAVGSERSLAYAGHRWTFVTPRGIRTVTAKERDPIWVPPDWHYVEVARRERLSLVWLPADTSIALPDGSSLLVHDMSVLLERDSTRERFVDDEEIILGKTLFVPPVGSPNRRVRGELGEYRLMLGAGVGIHGTPDKESVGRAVTHGCMRVHDADLQWLYEHIPIGTRVYIF